MPSINISQSKKYNQHKTFVSDKNKKYVDELFPTTDNSNLYQKNQSQMYFFTKEIII